MQKVFHKIISFTLALVVVFSTMSFTISSHFCGDTLVDTSYFGKAETCGMEVKQETKPKICSVSKKNCCNDVIQVLQGQDNLKVTSYDVLTFNQQLFVASFYYSYINLFEGLNDNVIPFKEYSSPLIVKDIHSLDEVYLI